MLKSRTLACVELVCIAHEQYNSHCSRAEHSAHQASGCIACEQHNSHCSRAGHRVQKASGCIAHEQHGGHCSRAESYHASSLRALLTSSTTAIALNRSDTFKTQHASLTLPSPGREERSFRLHRHDQEQEQKLQRACCCVRCPQASWQPLLKNSWVHHY